MYPEVMGNFHIGQIAVEYVFLFMEKLKHLRNTPLKWLVQSWWSVLSVFGSCHDLHGTFMKDIGVGFFKIFL